MPSANGTAPTYARPDGTHYTGAYAIRRQPGAVRPPIYYYPPSYLLNPWAFGFFGYGYGLDYFYNPGFGYGYPGYGYGYPGYGYGYPGYGYPGYGYGGGYPGYGYPGGYDTYSSGTEDTWEPTASSESAKEGREQLQSGLTGELRIKVKPREAKVLVDGVFMGTVDDYDGMFQKLPLREGRHQVTLQLEGYESLSFDVMIIPDQVISYQGSMHKVGDKR